mmetsp:Transcript_14206/g.44155  ORF Transcript_14206/g.44155 Transcript_14206/m.44155 type:complete len:134 (-) Transcript_14206:1731-2132(-)
MTMVVQEDARMASSSAPCTSCSLSTSSALVASSRSRTFGRFTTARAMARRCFWPPLSCTPRSPTSVERPSGSCWMKPQALARLQTSCSSASPTPAASESGAPTPKSRFSRMEVPKSTGSCATTPTCRRSQCTS